MVVQAAAPSDWRTRDFTSALDALDDQEVLDAFETATGEDLGEELQTGWVGSDEDLDALIDDEPAYIAALATKARLRCLAAIGRLRNSREDDVWEGGLHDDPEWVTLESGGDSYGDSPGPSYDAINLLLEAGVFQPLRFERVKRKD